MLQKIVKNLKTIKHKKEMQKQFLEIQKWQREMYLSKSRQEEEMH